MFDRKLYHEAMEELRAPQDKIEEIIAMTQQKTVRTHRRPIRTIAVAAAAVAMLSIGVSAANLEGVQEFFYHITGAVRVDGFQTNIMTEGGEQITVLDLTQITTEKRDGQVYLLTGEKELDITQSLEQDGRYEYRMERENGVVEAVVIGTPEEYSMDVSISSEDEDGVAYSYSVDSDGRVIHTPDGLDSAAISVYESEDGLKAREMP